MKRRHYLLRHLDGWSTVVPDHSGESLSFGLLAMILRDVELTRSELVVILACAKKQLRVFNYGVCRTFVAISIYSNPQSLCAWLVHWLTIAENSFPAGDLAFAEDAQEGVYQLWEATNINTNPIISCIYADRRYALPMEYIKAERYGRPRHV